MDEKPRERRPIDWFRWTVPPGVSLALHAIVIGLIAWISIRLGATEEPRDPRPLTELVLNSAPAVEDPPAPAGTEGTGEPDPVPQAARPARGAAPTSAIEDAAGELGAMALTKPRMDPVAQAALRRTSEQASQPASASPPSVRFAGVSSRGAGRIVYVVDGSGATANSFAYLQSQLLRSIDQLSPTQWFQVVLFRSFENQTLSYAPINGYKLARATRANKRAVSDWMSGISSRGRSNPVDGLRAALALRPDLVLLITRSIERTEMGWAQGQREILAQLDGLNPIDPRSGSRGAVIKTIQLLDEDPTGIMRAIGTIHGDGLNDYRVVTYEDLSADNDGDAQETAALSAGDEQRIESATELMSSLTESGASFSLMYSLADEQQRRSALESVARIRALVRPLVAGDGRATILEAQSVLLGAIADPGSISQDSLATVAGVMSRLRYSDPDTDAQRVLIAAAARARLGEGGAAIAMIEKLRADADDLGLGQSTRAQIALALVSLGVESGEVKAIITRPPFVTPSGAIDAVWGLLLREAMTRSRLRGAETPGELDHAWGPMVALRAAAGASEEVRNYIDTRITLILDSDATDRDGADLPSAVLLAAANTQAHDRDRREHAMGLLDQIASRPGDPAQAAGALWRLGVLGRAINTPDSIARSTAALSELARRYPGDPRAPDAIAGAIHATPPDDRAALRQRLRSAVGSFPDHPEIDLWRLALADLLDGFAVLDVLDPVSPQTREGVLAGELYEQTVLGMLDTYDDPRTRHGLTVRMRSAAERFGLGTLDMWTKRAATSETTLDPQAALVSIEQLIDEARGRGEATLDLELLRAQTLSELGQTHGAFAALSELSERIDATGIHTSTYWRAWSLMLETIVESGSPEDRAAALTHIARLGLIDPDLGGSPWKQRIIDARRTLHSSPEARGQTP